ncbi:MAG: hypothetical protein NTZ35_07330 [Ignavibacteriales bacterium]|nr:hypothetical protein [Ignavibacteriales bacterium]
MSTPIVIRPILTSRAECILLLFLSLPLVHSFAQTPLRVATLNELSIGTVTAGRTLLIRPSDAGAAKFRIVSDRDTTTIIRFFLPSQCSSLQGNEQLRIEYSSDGAAWSAQDAVSGSTLFDPRQPLTLQLQQNKPMYIWVGIVAYPHRFQQAGRYAANITLTVISLR